MMQLLANNRYIFKNLSWLLGFFIFNIGYQVWGCYYLYIVICLKKEN